MNKKENGNRTDTVNSINGSERVISNSVVNNSSFDYKVFCKDVMKTAKRKVDACLLVPIKVYHDEDGIREEKVLRQIEEWMAGFSKNSTDYVYFWVYMAYDRGYEAFLDWNKNSNKEKIEASAVMDSKTHMGDVSKLEKNGYIKKQCENRDAAEVWILNAYEIVLKKIYSAAKMALLIKDSIDYLRKCGIEIHMPALIETREDTEHIVKIMANLMLFVTRLRLEIPEQTALKWYKKGNVAYSGYIDQMLEEYMRVVNQYSYQSYERFTKMSDIARNNKNKYAAKEIGDVYRCGMELLDCHENRIFIKENQEIACEFYGICVEAEHIPAYICALKTDALIDDRQKQEILERSVEEKCSEGLVYHANDCMIKADKCVQRDLEQALQCFKDAANTILQLEDTYGEKHVMKNKLLLSRTFEVLKKEKNETDEELYGLLQKLYLADILEKDEEGMLEVMEEIYLLAEKQGYFEAEYRLGILFQRSNNEKSKKYFTQGKEKGCKWCMFEYARIQREQEPEGWLQVMMYLGNHMNKDEKFQLMLAQEWVDGGVILNQITSEAIKLKTNELIELYGVLDTLIIKINSKKSEDTDEISECAKLIVKLTEDKDKIGKLIIERQKLA